MRKAVKYGIAVVGVTGLAASFGLAVFGSVVTGHYTSSSRTADGIVVLTGGHQRLSHAAQLFIDGKARRLLVSGVNRLTSREDIRRLSAIPPHLFDCCVDIGYEARDTIGNADEARDWARIWNFSRLVIVTSDYHIPRSLAEFARAMPNMEIEPVSVTSPDAALADWWERPLYAKLIVSEYVKFWSSAARLGMARVHDRFEQRVLARAQDTSAISSLTSNPAAATETSLGGAPKIR
jgi:uncharacterized SAM-binding protein YcdF (DUF218 family)